MKRLLYILLIPVLLSESSCTMIIKGMGKSIAKAYDDQKDLNINNLEVADQNGKAARFGDLYAGKTVYMYVWRHTTLLPADDTNADYKALKSRFEKYNDVVFINLYTGETEDDWKQATTLKNNAVKAYHLSAKSINADFRELMSSSTSPQIIGKNGFILGFKGPRPADKLVVDYALFQARSGENATEATKTLIKGINSEQHFKNDQLTTWYESHYGKKPEGKLNVSISNSGNSISN